MGEKKGKVEEGKSWRMNGRLEKHVGMKSQWRGEGRMVEVEMEKTHKFGMFWKASNKRDLRKQTQRI